MKFNFIAKSLLVVGLASPAFAQQTTAEKTAKKQPLDVISGQTANVQLRGYAFQRYGLNGRAQETNDFVTQVRGNFTLLSFNNRLESTLVLAVNHSSDAEGVATKRRPELGNEFNAYDSTYFNLTPYVNVYAPENNGPTDGEVGLRPTLKHDPLNVGVGKLAFSFAVEGHAVFSSRKEDATFRSSDDQSRGKNYGLVASGDDSKPRRDRGQSYEVKYVPQVSLDLNDTVKGLSVGSRVEYLNTYNPVVAVNEDGEATRVYSPVRSTATFGTIKYKINDELSLINETSGAQTGLYEKSGEPTKRVEFANMTVLSYTMF